MIGLNLVLLGSILNAAMSATTSEQGCTNDDRMLALKTAREATIGKDMSASGIRLQMLLREERLLRAEQTTTAWLTTSKKNCTVDGSRQYCEYGKCKKGQSATLLWSYPGSGDTYIRALIESATGLYTGSVYNRPSIAKTMPGERLGLSTIESCATVSVINAHTSNPLPFSNVCGFPVFSRYCGGDISRAIILVRHPFSATWNQFLRQRLESRRTATKLVISKDAGWFPNWSYFGPHQNKLWSDLWRNGHPYREWMAAYGPDSYHLTRLEDLMVDGVREIELHSVLDFAGLNHLTVLSSIVCAFFSDLAAAINPSVSSRRHLLRKKSASHATIIESADPESQSAFEAWSTLGDDIFDNAWSKVEPIAAILGYEKNVTLYKRSWIWQSPLPPTIPTSVDSTSTSDELRTASITSSEVQKFHRSHITVEYTNSTEWETFFDLAEAFPIIYLLCAGHSCERHRGNHSIWRPSLRDRLVVMDAIEFDKSHGQEHEPHLRKATLFHLYVTSQVARSSGHEMILVCEADIEANSISGPTLPPGFIDHWNTALVQEPWTLLRLGSNPMVEDDSCPKYCDCSSSSFVAGMSGLCAVTRSPRNRTSHCDARSTVAYAVHQRAYDELDSYYQSYLLKRTRRQVIDTLLPRVMDNIYFWPSVVVQSGSKLALHAANNHIASQYCNVSRAI